METESLPLEIHEAPITPENPPTTENEPVIISKDAPKIIAAMIETIN